MDHPATHSDTYRDDDDDIFYLLNGVQNSVDRRKHETNRGCSSPELDTAGKGNSKTHHSKFDPNYDDLDIEMFVDVNGIPTDTFLESLKLDPLAASQHLTSQLESDFQLRSPSNFTAPKVQYQSRYLDSSSESDSDMEDYDSCAPHRNRNNFFQYMQEEKRHNTMEESPSSPPRSKSPEKKIAPTTVPLSRRVMKKKHSSDSQDYPGNPTPIPIASVVKVKEKKKIPGKRKRLSKSMDCGQGSSSMIGRQRRPKTPTCKSTETLHLSHNGDCNNTLKMTKQAEEKTESLKLRVKGQLNSIRVLETQLAEANHSIAVRDLELAKALKRVNQLEARERELNVRREHDEDIGRNSGKKEEGKVFQIKTELIALNARFNDEKSRRTRAEERLRIIKEFCEKQKIRTAEVEQKNEELESVLKQLHVKLQKKKQEVRATAKDVNVQRVRLVEKDSQLQTSKNQNIKDNRVIRDLRQDNDRLKEELRLLRREASSSEDKNRRTQLELEVLRERQTATKLAYRLQSQNQSLAQNAISPQSRYQDKSCDQGNRSCTPSSFCNSNSDNKDDKVRGCPYSRPPHGRSRSRSLSRSHRSSNDGSNFRKIVGSNHDSDDSTMSDDNSVDSYDVDQLITHHQNVSNDISSSMSAANLSPPQAQDEERHTASCRSHENSDKLQDVSLLSDSTGMGEEFDRLQKMYKRVTHNRRISKLFASVISKDINFVSLN